MDFEMPVAKWTYGRRSVHCCVSLCWYYWQFIPEDISFSEDSVKAKVCLPTEMRRSGFQEKRGCYYDRRNVLVTDDNEIDLEHGLKFSLMLPKHVEYSL
jgi:hypothetical protein